MLNNDHCKKVNKIYSFLFFKIEFDVRLFINRLSSSDVPLFHATFQPVLPSLVRHVQGGGAVHLALTRHKQLTKKVMKIVFENGKKLVLPAPFSDSKTPSIIIPRNSIFQAKTFGVRDIPNRLNLRVWLTQHPQTERNLCNWRNSERNKFIWGSEGR